MPTATINSALKDNHSRGKVADFLREKICSGCNLSIVSAYFTIYAYEALKLELDDIGHLRFLFGEPRFINALDPTRTDKKAFRLTDDGLTVANKLQQKRVARECAKWIREKVDVRSIRQAGFLHGKMYHIANGGVEEALVGSSNFTVRGLGLAKSKNNIELNLQVNDSRDRHDLKSWFNDLWNNEQLVTDVKEDVLRYLDKLYANHAPEFIYYLTLFNLFRDYIDRQDEADDTLKQIALPETGIWKSLFLFQKDGARAAINKLKQHNGCILADSVGLGKTYTALAVIKYFELRNANVLVLCPKKLRRNWTLFRPTSMLSPFKEDRFGYHVLSHTDLSRDQGEADGHDLKGFNWGAYDLVVIDESHNFRNNAQSRPRPGEERRKTRYEKLMDEIIRKGAKTKVLLLSATPVNNQLTDLRNQISFIAGGDVTADWTADNAFKKDLDIDSVKETTRKAQAHFTLWAKKSAPERSTRELLKSIGGDFFKLLDGLSIARSRRQIAKYYQVEMERLGGFPRRTPPRSLHPPIDLKERFLSFEKLNDEISALRLALYHPTHYLRPDLPDNIRSQYQDERMEGFTQEGRERILISMMKVNFLKRLESSVDSFRLTLLRTIEKIDVLGKRITAFEEHREENPEIDYDTLNPSSLDDPDNEEDEFIIGGRRLFHLAHIDLADWRRAIAHDRAQLQFLLSKTKDVKPDRDGKLAELKRLILEKLSQPTTDKDGRSNHKVLIFTAFSDTAQYLHDQIAPWVRGELRRHIALVRGDGNNKTSLGRTDYDDILTNFSPRSKLRAEQSDFPQDQQIDVLIATDCISEGQNLQDCDLLVNYDIHWNPVRIIQRFGRIDRIGSRNESVSLINFWPVADLDRYLNVKHRVEARMALVDLSATQSDNLLDPKQVEDLIEKDLLFRDRQLKKLQNEIIDLEDLDENVSLTDFSLDEFRIDLLRYLENRRDELENAETGLYAVVPAAPDIPMAQPGAIFCLRHLGAAGSAAPVGDKNTLENINPLGAYYLIYVLDDGTVRLTFTQPKAALNLCRELAAGHASAFEELCDLFDHDTKDGADMSHYNGLIPKALESIKQTFTKRALGGLLSDRGGKLPTSTETPNDRSDEFELVTWLVIKEPES